jgi:predicted  nucleic acid-binding Zn-ribbon protein
MGTKGQLDLLLELYELEQSLSKKKGSAKKILTRIEEVIEKIDPWVLKHYRRLKIPFGEFRDRTCWGCGMIYPPMHVHCRPSNGDVRLCDSCGKILLLIDEEANGQSGSRSVRGRPIS